MGAESVNRIAIYINNVLYNHSGETINSQYRSFQTCNQIVQVSVGDYIEIAVMQGAGSAKDLKGDDFATKSTLASIAYLGA